MRRFRLERDVDVTGISGTGHVAEGVEFTDGVVVVRWLAHPRRWDTILPTTVVHPSIENVIALHGHDGGTRVEWLDPDVVPIGGPS